VNVGGGANSIIIHPIAQITHHLSPKIAGEGLLVKLSKSVNERFLIIAEVNQR
jgi:hypothetical protein